MVGMLVLPLWQDVQVEVLLPENPEIPPLLALAGIDHCKVASSARTIQDQRVRVSSLREWKRLGLTTAEALRVSRDLLKFTVLPFFGGRAAHTNADGGRRMQIVGMLQPYDEARFYSAGLLSWR